MKDPTYISVDVEALGSHPQDYSLASIGACVVGNTSSKFYIELQPINGNFIQEAVDVCGLTINHLQQNGQPPGIAMQKFEKWLNRQSAHPIFVGFPLAFDMMWVHSYFLKYLGRDPFGRTAAGIDIKTYAMAKLDLEFKGQTTKKHLRNILGSWGGTHSHNALDDAIEQAYLFERLLKL